MATLNRFRTGLMRGRVAKYTVCFVLSCVAAVLMAVPIFGQTVTVTLVGAGDIARCDASYDEQTAQLIDKELKKSPDGTTSTTLPSLDQARVITLGDNAYSSGTRTQFAHCYDNYNLDSTWSTYDSSRPAWWGQYKVRTMPTTGNHEYLNSTDPSIQSLPYFDYFSAVDDPLYTYDFKPPAAPVPNTADNPGLTKGAGYYSYNLGSWHIVVLNSNCDYVSCDSGSVQYNWLANDLNYNSNPAGCTLAYMHHPLYATGTGGLEPRVKPLWQLLYDNGADVILNGHDHRYERLAPIDPSDTSDPDYGIRPIIAGTGGDPGGGTTATNEPNSEVKIFGTAGILRMDLSDASYRWQFIAVGGATGQVMDSGTESCHGAPGSGLIRQQVASTDTTPPDTIIDSGPSGTVKSGDATFIFSSTEPNSTFECSLDGAAFSACSSPKQYTGLASGSHTFEVRAIDAAGNIDPTPASRTWKVRAR